MSRRIAIAFACAGFAVASGCAAGKPASTGGSRTSNGTIVYAHKGEVPTMDPAHSDYDQTSDADRILYDTLVDFNPKGTMVGRLATSFRYAPDVRSVQITLRKGVWFHDGSTLTAQDVAYTLDRDKAIGTGIFTMITSYQSTTVTGPYSLVIHLSRPDTLFLGGLSRVYIVNSRLVKQHAGSDNAQSWLSTHEAGSGPYTLVSSVSGRIEATRFDKYWDYSAQRPKTFVESQVDQPSARRDGLIAGTIDAADVDVHDLPALRSHGLKIYRTSSDGMQTVYFNNTYGPTANPAVRAAIRLAFDYKGALDKIEAGAGTIASGPLPAGLPCRPNLPVAHQDLAKAKQILEQAGIHNLHLTIRFQPAFSDQEQEATLLQSNLQQIGVHLQLQPITYPAYLTMLSNWKNIPELMLGSESPAYPDPGVMLFQDYNSAAIGTNKAAYHNSAVDKLLNDAATNPDAGARCNLYRQAQTIIDRDDAVMPLINLLGAIAYSPHIGGVDTSSVTAGFDLAKLILH